MSVLKRCATPIIAVDFEELDSIASLISSYNSNLLSTAEAPLRDILETDGRRLLSALKMSCIIREWTSEKAVDEISDELDCYPFEVTRLCDSVSRLLQAFQQILTPQDDEPSTVMSDVSSFDKCSAAHQMVAHGIDEEAVTLTFISGLGGVLARRLRDSGICDIEELANAEVNDVSAIKGVSRKRAESWIAESEESVKTRHAWSFREDARAATVNDVSWPKDVDPYRLRRAMELDVRRHKGNTFLVTGGLEPHVVSRNQCDCLDFAKGHVCKHMLALRIKNREKQTLDLVSRLQSHSTKDGIDLFDLWFQNSHDRRLAS